MNNLLSFVVNVHVYFTAQLHNNVESGKQIKTNLTKIIQSWCLLIIISNSTIVQTRTNISIF